VKYIELNEYPVTRGVRLLGGGIYYTRLKEFIKNKLTRIDKPNNLKNIIKNIIRINNYFYKKSLEFFFIISGENKKIKNKK
jgi:hypothetical protein